MKSLTDTYKLRNGIEIPCVGFGTWQTPDDEEGFNAVKTALETGYRHIDTAAAYNNEEMVGRAVRESGIPREDIFITSKLWTTDYGYEPAKKAFEKTMANLGLEYLDLYLMHWPNPKKFRDRWQEVDAETWKAFEELYEEGRIKAIGVSNFLVRHLEPLLESAKIVPMVNQLRLAPGDTKDDTVDFCRKHDILPEAYSPLGTGKVFDVPELKSLAEKYGKTIAQVCLRWSLQMGFLPLPKSVTPEYIRQNADIFDFVLDDGDVDLLAGMKGCCGESSNPDTKPF